MTDYWTPAEWASHERHNARVRALLAEVVHDGAMLMVAVRMDQPAEVVEQLTNRFWDSMRASLSTGDGDDPYRAIATLLAGKMSEEFHEIMFGLQELAAAPEVRS